MKKNNLAHSPQPPTVEEQALSYLQKNGDTTVASLYNALKPRNPTLTETEVTALAWRLADKDRVNLEDVPPASDSIREYVRLWDRNLWFYFALGTSLITVLVVYVVPADLPFVAIRWVLGSVFVLFIPGYVTVEVLFPKGREIDGIERFALSVGLSLALVPLIGLLLNYTPWGIRLDPIVVSLTIYTSSLSIIGVARKFKMSLDQYEAQQLQG